MSEQQNIPEDDPRRVQILKWHADAVLEIKERAQRAFGELILREMDHLVFDGFSKEAAYLPAVNNLGVRKLEIQNDLLTELGRLQGVMRQRLQRLAEEDEDAREG